MSNRSHLAETNPRKIKCICGKSPALYAATLWAAVPYCEKCFVKSEGTIEARQNFRRALKEAIKYHKENSPK